MLTMWMIISAIANAIRGNGELPRIACAITIACCVFIATNSSLGIPYLLALVFTIWLGLWKGWGVYMRAAIDGVRLNEQEDNVTDMLVESWDNLSNHAWGMLSMSTRFVVWFFPAVALTGLSPMAAVLWLVGPVYYLSGRFTERYAQSMNPVRIAEFVTGGMIFLALV